MAKRLKKDTKRLLIFLALIALVACVAYSDTILTTLATLNIVDTITNNILPSDGNNVTQPATGNNVTQPTTGNNATQPTTPQPTPPEHPIIGYEVREYSCYQESANIANQANTDGQCGLLYTGNYSWIPYFERWSNTALGIDGNWSDSYATPTDGNMNELQIIYDKPLDAIGATWQMKGPLQCFTNVSIPSECFAAPRLTIGWFVQKPNYWEAWCQTTNSSKWSLLKTCYGTNVAGINEEAIIWQMKGMIPIRA